MSDNDLNDLDELLEEALDDLKEKEARNEENARKKDEELNAAVSKVTSMNFGDDVNVDGYISIINKLLSSIENEEVEEQEKETLNKLKGVVQLMEKGNMDEACTLMENIKADNPVPTETDSVEISNEADVLSLLFNNITNEQKNEKNLSTLDTSSSSRTALEDPSIASSPDSGIASAESEILKTIIETSLSPEILDLFEKMTEGFPRWIEAKKHQLSEKELELRQKQYEKTVQLCCLMREGFVNEKVMQIIDLFNELSELGELPQELSDYATTSLNSEENKAQ